MLDKKVRTITSGITLALTDIFTTIRCDSDSSLEITLPTASGFPNFNCDIMNKNTGEVTCGGLIIPQDSHAHIVCDGTNWSVVIGGGGGAINLGDLEDVVTAPGLSNGQVLTYGEGSWINADLPEPFIPTNLYQLEDIDFTGSTDGAILVYNGTTDKWENGPSIKVLDANIYLQIGSVYEGTGTISVTGTTVTGDGTSFLTQVAVGDGITGDDQEFLGYVQSITSDTELEFDAVTLEPWDGAYLINTSGDDSNPIVNQDPESYPILGWRAFSKITEFLDSYAVFTSRAYVSVVLVARKWNTTLTISMYDSYRVPMDFLGYYSVLSTNIAIYDGYRLYFIDIMCPSFSFYSTESVFIDDCYVSNSSRISAYTFNGVIYAYVSLCEVTPDCTNDNIILASTSNVYVEDLTGVGLIYGLYATKGSNIYKIGGPYPTGGTANEFSESAGLIR